MTSNDNAHEPQPVISAEPPMLDVFVALVRSASDIIFPIHGETWDKHNAWMDRAEKALKRYEGASK